MTQRLLKLWALVAILVPFAADAAREAVLKQIDLPQAQRLPPGGWR